MDGKIPVTVIVMTKNEEHNVRGAIDSVCDFSEIVVVDSHSTDRTRAIAAAHGARLVDFRWNGQLPKKKEWSLRNAVSLHDWVLFLDADERVPPSLVSEIDRFVADDPSEVAMAVTYDYVFLGKRLKFGYKPKKIVLMRRSACRFPDVDDSKVPRMWEVEGHFQPAANGSVGVLRSHMLHDDADDLYAYFARHNRYSDWEASVDTTQYACEAATSAPRAAIKSLWLRSPGRGLVAFVQSFILALGFLDGRPGFHYAMARAFYYWQISVKRRARHQQ